MESALFLALPLGLAVWAGILIDWRWGVYGIVFYTPFTGPVVAALYPSPVGNLARDILVVVPLYVSLFLLSKQARLQLVPPWLYVSFGLFALIVLFAAANPSVPNLVVAGIGTKVWLFYIPMLIVGASFVRSEQDLRGFLRALVVTAWLPWCVGIIMFLGSILYGYEETITYFYGEYARSATQNFTYFTSYGAVLYRIPGSFQFNSQYGAFCYFMLFPILMLLEIERIRAWRALIWVSMFVGLVAGFTSGARGNFVFMPLVFVMVQFFKFKASGLVQSALGVGAALFTAMSISGIDTAKMYGEVGRLTATYGQEMGVGGMFEAMERGGVLGRGVGSNTGATRHGIDPADAMLFQGGAGMVENYYAKAMVELGVVGFMILVLCAVLTLLACLRIQRQLRNRSLKNVAACGTALTAFIMIASVKGWALDSDPLNYYYYLVLGMVFALPYVERRMAAAAAVRTTGSPDLAGSRRIAGPLPALRGQPAVAEPAYRLLIGRHGFYGTAAGRNPPHVLSRPRNELAPKSPGRGDAGDGNS